MKQSKFMSLCESIGGTAIGFVVAFFANMLVLPLFGYVPSLTDNLLITMIYTVISIVRGFGVRRLFEALHIRRPLSPFMQAVIAECYRQREIEGYDIAHDEQHSPRELAQAGAAYLIGAEGPIVHALGVPRNLGSKLWPWNDGWKPAETRRDLVRGCALGIAGGELGDRLGKRKVRKDSPMTGERIQERSPLVTHLNLAHNKTASEQGGAST